MNYALGGWAATFVNREEPHKTASWVGNIGMMLYSLMLNLTPLQPSWPIL